MHVPVCLCVCVYTHIYKSSYAYTQTQARTSRLNMDTPRPRGRSQVAMVPLAEPFPLESKGVTLGRMELTLGICAAAHQLHLQPEDGGHNGHDVKPAAGTLPWATMFCSILRHYNPDVVEASVLIIRCMVFFYPTMKREVACFFLCVYVYVCVYVCVLGAKLSTQSRWGTTITLTWRPHYALCC